MFMIPRQILHKTLIYISIENFQIDYILFEIKNNYECRAKIDVLILFEVQMNTEEISISKISARLDFAYCV